VLRRTYFLCAYFASWAVFGAVCLGLNAYCAVLLLLPNRERRGPALRRTIRRLFGSWCGWLRATRIVAVRWHGPDLGENAIPTVCVANHPGLLDATFLLSRIPDAVCIFKTALRRNPLLAPAAIMAGYVSGENWVDLIHKLADEIGRGRTLLIFPEGTRTSPDRRVNPLMPAFGLIARRAAVPIQVVVIRASRDLLARGDPWWRAPRLPAQVDIYVDDQVRVSPGQATDEIIAAVQARFDRVLDPSP
jgi:1-acyl-sn-glycerol-3-phosphate acyltransferase